MNRIGRDADEVPVFEMYPRMLSCTGQTERALEGEK